LIPNALPANRPECCHFLRLLTSKQNKNRLKKEIVGVEVAQGKGVFDTDSIVCASLWFCRAFVELLACCRLFCLRMPGATVVVEEDEEYKNVNPSKARPFTLTPVFFVWLVIFFPLFLYPLSLYLPAALKKRQVPQLRTVFKKDGTITAANASKLSDGACAVVLTSGDVAAKRGLKPLAIIRGVWPCNWLWWWWWWWWWWWCWWGEGWWWWC
jgi:hypothetical protein